jgi:hypothetical protein
MHHHLDHMLVAIGLDAHSNAPNREHMFGIQAVPSGASDGSRQYVPHPNVAKGARAIDDAALSRRGSRSRVWGDIDWEEIYCGLGF